MRKTVKIVIGLAMLISLCKGFLYWSDNHSRTKEISNLTLAPSDCLNITRRGPERGAIVDGERYHCLTAPLILEGHHNSFTPEGPKYYRADSIALLVAADNTTLDFRGHLVRSRADGVDAVNGARVAAGGDNSGRIGGTAYLFENWQGFFKNITVKNGRAELKYRGMGIYFPGDAHWYVAELNDRLKGSQRESYGTLITEQKRKVRYSSYNVDRNIVIDTMHIRSKDPGILIQGGRTIIRNSVIETDDTTGIWVFGSNALIEGNIIIVHRAESSWWDDYGAVKRGAPIRLVYADGAVIRNNRIVIKGFAKGSAVSITDSKSVILENNQIFGINPESPLAATYDGAELPRATNTTFEPGWKAWFIGGVFNY